ncbi:hypothetical protein PR202_ga01757 [Eleusine coracana subsp. coracana]|uniref:SKP1 component POZ domain-containing protein n=1 Tax=Eleusine coracana subsp. coracana TaxID=191504 RepID=A0AAV5BFX2_ELECO|nr:hypothetical protein PR202_ga01070 [Eleusine coracana subsp. coracana]GJM85946.1 hypothetical protein PR202_ga01757 [Eleusine coracana subsp. coracana]
MGSPGTKMIRLVSSDSRAFDVPEKIIAAASGTIKSMLNAGHAADAVPIPNVTAATLTRVLDYVEKHSDDDLDAGGCSFLPRADRPPRQLRRGLR